MKIKDKQRKLRRFAGFAYDMMPAGCGLDFEGISSPQSTAITAKKSTGLITVLLADSTDDCTGIRTGNDVKLRERESTNNTHHAHSKMTGSRPGTAIDQKTRLWSHNIIRPKYIRYLKAAQGEAGYNN